MEWLHTIFGQGKDINSLQMVCRAVGCFFITLALIRFAGVRTFGTRTAFDNVITIMLGSIFSRVVVGASPFIPTTLACLAFVLVHRGIGWLSVRNDWVGRLVKGEKSVLYAGAKRDEKNMQEAMISEKDLMESVRLKINSDDLAQVREIIIERNGEISVLKNPPKNPTLP